jgi:hypothetical protein
VEIVAAPVLVESAIRITGSADRLEVDDLSEAVLTTELFSVGQRLAPSLDDRSVGFCPTASPANDDTKVATSKRTEIFGEGYFISLS